MASEESVENLKGHVKELESALDTASKENDTLTEGNRELNTENRTLRAEGLFRARDLPSSQAALFVASNPEVDITDEAVDEFVETYKLAPVSEEGGSEEKSTAGKSETSKEGEGLESMSGAGTRPGEGGKSSTPGSITKDEYKALHKENPAAARQALQQGRVELRPDNYWVQQGVVATP